MIRPHRGQATVELALALPFVAVALLLVVQVLLVALAQLRVDHAAREGARAAAVSSVPGAAARVAVSGVLGARHTEARTDHPEPEHVRVEVTHRFVTDVPLVGRFVPDLTLAGESIFRVESS